MARNLISIVMYIIGLSILIPSIGGLMGLRIDFSRFSDYTPLSDIEDIHNIYWGLFFVALGIIFDYVDDLNEQENNRIENDEDDKEIK